MSNAVVATEQGHWYCAKTGEPRYTITGKNGKERNTTLADARKLGFVPSVTTITKMLPAPGLVKWKAAQVLLSAFTMPVQPGHDYAKWCEAVEVEAAQKAKDAAQRGTELHGDIERWLQGAPHGSMAAIQNIYAAMEPVGIDLHAGRSECSFAHEDGYGGKVDWHSLAAVVDFKTKDKIEEGKRLAWDEHHCQLAAYAHGLGLVAPRCLNVFVGVNDGKVVVVEHKPVEIARGLRLFKCCLALWQEVNQWHGQGVTVADDITNQTGGRL
jgi:hypothetical protein